MVASGKLHIGMKIDAARVDIGSFPLMQLICKAYDVKAYQVVGPDWLKTGQRFDIVATLPAGATKEQVPEMLQSLLAERFRLAAHRETKDSNVYALVVAKGGPKIKESAPPPEPAADAPAASSTGSSSVSVKQVGNGAVVSDGQGMSQKVTVSPDQKSMRMEISNITMAKLAEALSPMVDRPIMDFTELKGNYDVALDVSMQEMLSLARAAGAAVPPPPPPAAGASPGNPADAVTDPGSGSIFTAIQALGLKLEKRKAPLPTIVIDKLEKMPTEN